VPSQSGGDDDIDDAVCSALVEEQLRSHARLFFRIANGVLRDPEAAEDACQLALAKAWNNRRRLRTPEVFRGWVCRAVFNESLAMARRRRLERQTFISRLLQGIRWATTGDLATGGEKQAGRHDVDRDEPLREALLVALEQLPESLRTIVLLRDLDGEKGTTVAALLGLTGVEVSRLLHEGRRRIRERVKELLGPGQPIPDAVAPEAEPQGEDGSRDEL
jgi:RNA polymerase sigma-70 factor, ECF subfamily